MKPVLKAVSISVLFALSVSDGQLLHCQLLQPYRSLFLWFRELATTVMLRGHLLSTGTLHEDDDRCGARQRQPPTGPFALRGIFSPV